MIIEKQNTDVVVLGDEMAAKKATISADKMAKLQYILTKGLYKDPITAVIAEWTNNGVDSVRQAGKSPVDNPVVVEIGKNHLNQSIFSVEDKGQGLDDKDFEEICMNYLESTKETHPDTIGCYGIGMKSFLSLERSATFTCRKNGVERKYLVYEGEEFVNYTLISQQPTKEENGVKAELVIKDHNEKHNFYIRAKQKLAYYDTVVLIVDGKAIENTITRSTLFQWSSLNANWDMHLCLKDVYYEIDFKSLGIPAIPIPIALRFELTDGIVPTPSRESYITNEKTKKLILDRIKEISRWMVDRYNETVKEFPTIYAAWEHLGTPNYIVKLKDSQGKVKEFTINNLVSYSSVPLLSPKVKGMKYIDPVKMKSNKDYFFYEWDMVAATRSDGTFRKMSYYHTITGHLFNSKKKPIIVGPVFAGNAKIYLGQKYGPDSLFVRKNGDKRNLSNKSGTNWDSWEAILGLSTVNKKLHKDYIDEWESVVGTLTDMFIDETLIENDPKYLDWLAKRKQKQKDDRAAGLVKGPYKGINKQTGDVTMAYARPHVHNTTMVFEKKAYKISDMENPHFKTVLLKETDDLELMKDVAALFVTDKLRFAVVGPREVTKLPKSKQFIDMDTFKSLSCKPFMRMASAIVFREVINDYDKIMKVKSGIFKNCLTSTVKDRDTLAEYVKNYLQPYHISAKAEAFIVNAAEANKLYDKTLWDVYLRVKESIKKYEFISVLSEPYSWDAVQQKKYVKFIKEQLIFRKKFYKDVDESLIKQLDK